MEKDSFLSRFKSEYSEHKNQIVFATDFCAKLHNITGKITLSNQNISSHKRLQCEYLLHTIKDINNSLIDNFKLDYFSSVEALSRVSIELSVNLIYLLREDHINIEFSYLIGHIENSLKKTSQWLNYAKRNNEIPSIKIANKKIAFLTEFKKILLNTVGKNLPIWPKTTFEKFKETGNERFYRTIFASASNSIHSFSDDIFNITQIMIGDNHNKDELVESYFIEKTSFAMYSLLVSLAFYLECAHELGRTLDQDNICQLLKEIAPELEKLLREHDACTIQFELGSEK